MPEDRQSRKKSNDYEQSPDDDSTSNDGSPGTQPENSSPADELKTAQDRYLRLAAEFENFKKRSQKDLEEFRKYANERLLKELLPVLDNLERALQHSRAGGNPDGVLQGVELTSKQYQEILSRFGVKPIASVGQRFDPAVHHAAATVDAKGREPNTVVEEYEKGYYLHDRVLRPATVTVTASSSREQDHD
jgi:molecular chaperone GrpE